MSDNEAPCSSKTSLEPVIEAQANDEPKEGTSNKRKREETGDDEVVTMVEVLEDEKALEEDAKAVLGNADDKNCSYHTGGYMKRQALYACLTCCVPQSPDFEPAAICLACSYECHPEHEIVELYTKRRFRCDCGNSKFKDNPCRLAADKAAVNEDNKYNQNFRGLYCTCHRPYPDPEDDSMDEMIQCIVCEDWYHGRHLQGVKKLLSGDSYSEMICHLCYEKHQDFLFAYKGLAVTEVAIDKAESDQPVEVSSETAENGITSKCVSDEKTEEPKIDGGCVLKKAIRENGDISALFLPDGWRDQLCTCDDCNKLYTEHGLDFLLDPEDTVHYYESKAKNEGSQYDASMNALTGVDRVQLVEGLQMYNDMKEELFNFLSTFPKGSTVTAVDIKEFFEKLQASKRRRVEIPRSCH